MQKIICPNPEHKENTPSCVVYDEYLFCFGCGYRSRRSELGDRQLAIVSKGIRKPLPTDIKGELERIKALPLARVRGLELPVDGDSYYIIWPSGDYYKRRKFLPGDGPKYINPRGHAKPLFIPRQTAGCKSLAIVEGEINALSLSATNPPFDVCSPGGINDFNEKLIDQNCSFFVRYTRFRVIIDKQQQGLNAVKRFKPLLLKISPYVEVILVSRDCNELLVAGELEKEVKSWGSA